MKRLTRLMSFILILGILMALCACGSSGDNDAGDTTDVQEGQTEVKEETKSEYKVGETWTVEGQWSLTVNKVTETKERNEYSDEKPAAVYMIDYTYENFGYEDSTGLMDGLYISFDDMIVDVEGTMGYDYPGDISSYPQETPVGATCKAQACIGVDNPGIFTIELKIYDSKDKEQKATFIMDPEAQAVESKTSDNNIDTSSALKINETWTVANQWELTITGVKEVKERNEYDDHEPEAVYLVDYSYKNLGYEDADGLMDGLYFSLDNSIVDAKGTMGYPYSGDTEKYPEETPVGATCNAQVCIGVDHAGPFTINVLQYTGDNQKETQSFYIEVK